MPQSARFGLPVSPRSAGPAGARPRLGRAVVLAAGHTDPDGGRSPSPAPILAERLARRATHVDLIVDPVCCAPEPGTRPDPGGSPSAALSVPRADLRVDLVVGVTGTDGGSPGASELARHHGARLLLVVQGLTRDPGDDLTDNDVAVTFRSADRITIPDESFRHPLHGHGVDERRVLLLPPWVPSAPTSLDRSDARRRLGWPERAFIAVHTGPMDPARRLVQFVEAARLLGPGSVVVLAGDGPARPALESQAQGVPNVLVPAAVDDEQRALAVVAADVLLLSEPVAGVRILPSGELARYLNAGRPVVAAAPVAGVVASDLSRAGDAGLVVPPGEPRRIAGALLALRSDPSRRVAMALAGMAYAEAQFSPRAVLSRFDGIVDAVLDDPDPVPREPAGRPRVIVPGPYATPASASRPAMTSA